MEAFEIAGRHWLFERKDRKRGRYGVGFRTVDGKMVKRTFETKEGRRDFLVAQKLGMATGGFDSIEWQRWVTLKSNCDRFEISPEEMFSEWKRLRPVKIRKTLVAAVDEYMSARKKFNKDHTTHDRLLLEDRFVPSIGAAVDLHAIDKRKTEAFLNAQTQQPVTFRNNLTRLKTFFRWAKRAGYISEVPTDGIDLLPIPFKEPGTLTVIEATALFEANEKNAEVCALLALGAFAGIRTSGVDRLEPGEIRLKEKQIYFPAAKFKTGRSHLIEHAPKNLWSWLARANLKKMCEMTARQKAKAREDAYISAGLLITKAMVASNKKLKSKAPPHNCLRHSFATYKCALDGSAEKASFILGHSNHGEIWQSYKGIATKEDAAKYFSIRPNVAQKSPE